MKIGAHVSAAGGIFNAPGNASKIGCEVFQVFSRPPQGGPASKLTPDVVERLKAAMKEYGFADFTIHTPYYINFASTTPRIRYGSISIVREELERGTVLGASYVVTHLGSDKEAGQKLGRHKTWQSIQRVLDGYRGTTKLLLELSAGAGGVIGDTFEELAEIINSVEKEKNFKNKVGICIDTCHAYASGMDIRTKVGLEAMVKHCQRTVGLDRLHLIHGNDSKFDLGGRRDRHEHIGKGQIGLEGFRALLNHPKLKLVPLVIETPWDETLDDDIRILKKLRKR